MPDATVWEDIRIAYADPTLTIEELCQRYGLTTGQLRRQRLKEGWPPRLDATQLAKAKAAARRPTTSPGADPEGSPGPDIATAASTLPPATSTPPAPLKRKPTPIAQRRALVQRLTDAIETKLKLLERRFEREILAVGKAASAADTERDIRAIGTLIKNLEHVTEYDDGHGFGKSAAGGAGVLRGAAAKSASIAASALADEADRLRHELGLRLQRLVDPAG